MHNPTLANLAVPWDGDRDDTLVCRAVRQETPDVKTFVFSAPEPRLFRYAPGLNAHDATTNNSFLTVNHISSELFSTRNCTYI